MVGITRKVATLWSLNHGLGPFVVDADSAHLLVMAKNGKSIWLSQQMHVTQLFIGINTKITLKVWFIYKKKSFTFRNYKYPPKVL